MGSPESEKPASKSPPVQDSPIFGYVSSLSPIKPVNARPHVQVYENIDVPSPQLIFKTPNFCRPRVSSLSERSQHLTSSGTEGFSPGYVNNTREFPGNMDITRASSSMPTAQFSSCGDKECTGGDPSPNQSCISPSNCVDVFLADPSENGDSSSSSPEFCVNRYTIEREGINTSSCKHQMETLKEDFLGVHLNTSAVSVDEKRVESLLSRQDAYAHHPSQNTVSVSAKEYTADIHAANTKKHTSRMSVMCLRSFRARDQTEERSGSISLDATMEINKGPRTEQQFQQVSKNVSIHTDAHITLDSITQHKNESANQQVMDPHTSRAAFCDPAQNGKENFITSNFLCHNEEDPKLQSAKSGVSDESSGMLQLNPGSPPNTHRGNNHMDNLGQMSFASASNRISYDLEDCAQQQRGKRKRLQFEAADNLRINDRDSFNHSTEASNVDMSTALLEAGPLNASHPESMTTSSQSQLLRSNTLSRFLVKVDRSGGSKETSLAAPRPPGLLHLNSIGSAAPTNCNSNMQRAEMNSSIQEERVSEDIDEMPEISKNCPSSMIVIDPENLNSSAEEPLLYAGIKENEENKDGNRPFQKQHSSVSYWSSLNVKPLNTTVPLKHIDRCITPCTMKSLPSVEADKTEEFIQTSPRKKRKKAPDNDGQKRCNCKRSKCLKLYCDCFAAGSYCSEACACYECSNRLEHEETVRETRQQIESRNPLAFAPKVILRVSDPPKPSGDNKQITPTSARHKRGCNCKKSRCLKKYCECFQAGVGCSLGCRCEGCKNTFGTKEGCEISEMVVEHKRPGEGGWERDLSTELEAIEVKRHIAHPRQCHPRLSPVTPLLQSSVGNGATKPQFPSSYFPSPDSIASAVRSHEPSGADLGSMDDDGLAEDGPGASSFTPCDPENEYQIAGKVDTFSPGWEGFPDICNLSPLLKASPSAGGSSSVLKTREHRILQMKLFQGGSRISLGAFCLGSSPVTPMPHFDESKLPREPDSNSGLHCDTEDDTPEILKETCSPVKSIKASSPNQKRVSPPHHVMCSTSTSSPSGLKSGRKYVLQSVPAFPSLTPYSKSNREDGT